MHRLDGVSEEGGVVAGVLLHLLLSAGVLMRSLVSLVTAGVLASEVDSHEDAENAAHGSSGDQSPVTGAVVGGIILAVDEARDGTTKVTEADVHGNTNTTLERTTNVVAVPGDTLGNIGVDTAGDEESGEVLGTVGFDSSKDDETNDGDNTEEDHVDTTLAMSISSETTADGEETGDDVGRNRHELSHLVGVAETLDDGGKEDGDGIERSVDSDGDHHVNPDLPVLESILGELHVEGIRENRSILLETSENLLALGVVEELGSVGVVVHDKESHDSEDESDETLNDEDPSPAIKTTKTLHLHDTTSKETTESTSSSSSREENSHAETALMSLIPESDVVSDTGEETTLSETESHASGEKTTKVIGDTHKGCDDGPGDHDAGNPDGGTEALHGHVGGDLGCDVEGEEDGDGDIVIPLAGHAQGLFETSELSITDVCTIEERKEVKKSQEGKKLDVHLAEESLGSRLIEDLLGGILVEGDGLLIVDLFG